MVVSQNKLKTTMHLYDARELLLFFIPIDCFAVVGWIMNCFQMHPRTIPFNVVCASFIEWVRFSMHHLMFYSFARAQTHTHTQLVYFISHGVCINSWRPNASKVYSTRAIYIWLDFIHLYRLFFFIAQLSSILFLFAINPIHARYMRKNIPNSISLEWSIYVNEHENCTFLFLLFQIALATVITITPEQ